MAYPTIREITIDELLAESGADAVTVEARGDENRDPTTNAILPGMAVITATYGKQTIVKTLSTKHINPDDALRECARMAAADKPAPRKSKAASADDSAPADPAPVDPAS